MVLSSLVASFVVHLLEPAINRYLYGDLCNLGVQDGYGNYHIIGSFVCRDQSIIGMQVNQRLFV